MLCQRRVTHLEEQLANLEYLLSDLLPGKARRDISLPPSSNTEVYFSAVRSEVIRSYYKNNQYNI